MKLSQYLFILFLFMAGPMAAQQTQICRQARDWRAERSFSVRADGTVIDARAGLQWQRCALGQRGRDCRGEPQRLSAMQAHDQVHEINRQGFAGHKDWRLPSRAELEALVSPNCVRPAISLRSFPNTPATPFWPHTEPGPEGQAEYVDFESGFTGRDDRNLPNAVRLVRSLKPRKASAGAVMP